MTLTLSIFALAICSIILFSGVLDAKDKDEDSDKYDDYYGDGMI